MSGKLYKFLLLLLAAALLAGVAQVQNSLNRDRGAAGPDARAAAGERAAGARLHARWRWAVFAGLISNVLWIRANDLQDEDKFFEMAQLADWITKLEPHFVQVWIVQAWNMAYNISVKFKDFADRWRWVRRGIELLRDEGLRYNPERDPHLPRTGVVLPAQDGRRTSTTRTCITSSSGPMKWPRSSARRNPTWTS